MRSDLRYLDKLRNDAAIEATIGMFLSSAAAGMATRWFFFEKGRMRPYDEAWRLRDPTALMVVGYIVTAIWIVLLVVSRLKPKSALTTLDSLMSIMALTTLGGTVATVFCTVDAAERAKLEPDFILNPLVSCILGYLAFVIYTPVMFTLRWRRIRSSVNDDRPTRCADLVELATRMEARDATEAQSLMNPPATYPPA